MGFSIINHPFLGTPISGKSHFPARILEGHAAYRGPRGPRGPLQLAIGQVVASQRHDPAAATDDMVRKLAVTAAKSDSYYNMKIHEHRNMKQTMFI